MKHEALMNFVFNCSWYLKFFITKIIDCKCSLFQQADIENNGLPTGVTAVINLAGVPVLNPMRRYS